MADFALLEYLKLISRNIWVIEESWNLYTVLRYLTLFFPWNFLIFFPVKTKSRVTPSHFSVETSNNMYLTISEIGKRLRDLKWSELCVSEKPWKRKRAQIKTTDFGGPVLVWITRYRSHKKSDTHFRLSLFLASVQEILCSSRLDLLSKTCAMLFRDSFRESSRKF